MNKKVGFIEVVFATCFMGSLGLFVKHLSSSVLILTFFRLFLPAVFLGIFFRKTITKTSIKAILGGVFLSLTIIFYIISIKKIGMATSVFELYLGPILASVFSFIALKEPLEKFDIFCMLIALSGLLVILKFKIDINIEALYGLLSGIFYGLLITTNKAIKDNLISTSFFEFVAGSISTAFFMLFFKGNINFILADIPLIVIMAVVCGLGGITLMIAAIKNLSTTEFGVFSYLEVFFAVLFGVIAGETLSVEKIIGGGLITAGGILMVVKSTIKGHL